MKRFFSLILILSLLVTLAACGAPEKGTAVSKPMETAGDTPASVASDPAQTVAGSRITPLLYRVTDGDGHVVWLFGSIHVGEESYYPLPDYVLSAYGGADALAVECDVVAFASDLSAATRAMAPLIYMDGTKISDHISEKLYTEAMEAMKSCGTYMSWLDMYKPIMWYSLLESYLMVASGARTELGIDMYFLNDAHENGKEIREIESAEFQYGMLADFSEELQILLLEDIVETAKDPASYTEELDKLLELWAAGDEDAFGAYLEQEDAPVSDEEAVLIEEFNKAMITDRNSAMADYAEAVLKSGEEIFICVGAAHVVGEGAMADLLAQRGYTVEKVSP